MTVTCDSKRRVPLPSAKPGDQFEVQLTDGGKLVLTPLDSADRPDNIRLIKRRGYTVAKGTRPITHAQVRRLLDEFP